MFVQPPLAPTIKAAYSGGEMATLWFAVGVLFVGAGLLSWQLRDTQRRQTRILELPAIEPTPLYDDQHIQAALLALRKDVGTDLEEVANRIKTLTQAVAEGIERVDRSERRIGATITRAQKKLALAGYEDPGITAEVEGLRLLDGDGGEDGGLPAVQQDVEDPRDRPSSIPGATIAQLQRVRGF